MRCHKQDTNSRNVSGQVLTTREWYEARTLIIQQFMPRELRPDRNIVAGERLKLARIAFGFSGKGAQGRFAAEAGLKPNRYNQWETGERSPPAWELVQLCTKFKGLTLDWVYMGKTDGMPHWLAKTLDDLMEVEPKAPAQPIAVTTPPVPVHKATFVKTPARKKRTA